MLLGEKNLELTITRIQESLKSEKPPSWADLRKPTGGLYGIVWVGVGLSVFQQFVGINVIFYYSNVLWEAVGFDESQSFIITVITSVTNIADHADRDRADRQGRPQTAAADRLGRHGRSRWARWRWSSARPRWSTAQPHLEGAAGPIALVAANLFVVAFGMSWGPVVWVLLGEMFPNRIRAAALGLAAAAQWMANCADHRDVPRSWARSRCRFAYGFYALCAVLSFIFVWRWVEETKGKHLEDMHGETSHLPAAH